MAKRTSKTGRNLKKSPKSTRTTKTSLAKGLDGQIVQQALAQLPAGYGELLDELKQRIRTSQVRAATSVNRELVLLYWQIGRGILERQESLGWGAKVVDQLARDLTHEFPEMTGFSPRNLKYMRAFAAAHRDPQIVQEALAQITWYHNITLLEKVKDVEVRLWYARQTALHGWSRSVLVMQIETEAHKRQGQAITNFDRTLPPPQSDLARQLLKDPYTFEFLTIAADAHERELERSLIEHIKQFLLELGAGFAFVGSQFALEVGGNDFFIDLLFYHLKLRCFIAIDLKTEAFQPEHAGKMNFYLAALDNQIRHPDDGRSIGLILCKDKNRVIVEYASQDMGAPLGVASFRLLPEELRNNLPSPEQLASEVHKYEQLTKTKTDN